MARGHEKIRITSDDDDERQPILSAATRPSRSAIAHAASKAQRRLSRCSLEIVVLSLLAIVAAFLYYRYFWLPSGLGGAGSGSFLRPEQCSATLREICSSVKLTEECKATQYCRDIASHDRLMASAYRFPSKSRVAAIKPVLVSVYYETHCPDSKDFIVSQLYPTVKRLNSSIIDFELVPYGKATEHQTKDGSYRFDCQHGPPECLGNTIQACAIHLVPQRVSNEWRAKTLLLDFVTCMERAADPVAAAPDCARKKLSSSGIEWETINLCAHDPTQSASLLHEMAVKTGAKPSYVPKIVINGVYSTATADRAGDNLLRVVCDAFKGPKPTACR